MLEWKAPELKELNLSNTEASTLDGKEKDGEYIQVLCYKHPLKSDGCIEVPPCMKK